MKNRKWWQSSDDAKKLSRTVKGFFTSGVIASIVVILSFIGIDITDAEVNSIVENVSNLIAGIGMLGGFAYGLYGAIMKVWNRNK